MKKKLIIGVIILSMLTIILTGCSSGEDTRQFIDTMGVVFTNDADDVINELYVFPIAIDGTDVLEQDMGSDLIKNTGSTRRVGSFGVTIEMLNTGYNVMARDRSQGIYIFENVPLSNVCEAVLTFDRAADLYPLLTIHHKNGGSQVLAGDFIPPHDAPDHAHIPLRKTATLHFNVENNTNKNIVFISIREADHPSKGEVELYIGELKANTSTSLNYRLFEEDKEITDWLLYIQTSTGESIQFEESFDPWETNLITISLEGGSLAYKAS